MSFFQPAIPSNMTRTFEVQVYPTRSFHRKWQISILLMFAGIALVNDRVLPEALASTNLFFLLGSIPVVYLAYRKYLKKAFTCVNESLTISEERVNFQGVDYSKCDIGFYRYTIRGVNYGSVIKLGSGIIIFCNNLELPDYKMYEGDYSGFKRSNIFIENDPFEALKHFKYSTT